MHDRELSFPNRRLAFGAGSRGAVNLRMVSPLDAHADLWITTARATIDVYFHTRSPAFGFTLAALWDRRRL